MVRPISEPVMIYFHLFVEWFGATVDVRTTGTGLDVQDFVHIIRTGSKNYLRLHISNILRSFHGHCAENVFLPMVVRLLGSLVDRDMGITDHVRNLQVLVVGEGPEKVRLFHRDNEKPVILFGNLMEGSQPVNVSGREAGQHRSLCLSYNMFGFLKHFLFSSKISPDQVGPFAEKQLGLRTFSRIHIVLRHVRLRSMRTKVATVVDRSLRSVNKEPVGPRNPMFHMDRFYLDLSETQTISGSEGFEF